MAEIPTAVEAELARLRAENARLLRLLKHLELVANFADHTLTVTSTEAA